MKLTEAELEERYIEHFRPTIEHLKTYVDDTNFQKFMDIKDVYQLFYPLNIVDNSFVVKCSIFQTMDYEINDGEGLVLVEAVCQGTLRSNTIYEITHFFVMRGFHNDLDISRVNKYAMFHHSDKDKLTVKKYRACNIGWDIIPTILEYQEKLKLYYEHMQKKISSRNFSEINDNLELDSHKVLQEYIKKNNFTEWKNK